MMNDDVRHMPPLPGTREDFHRYDGREEAEKIRAALQRKCFNEEDRDQIASHLTDDERVRVRFTWLVFPGAHR